MTDIQALAWMFLPVLTFVGGCALGLLWGLVFQSRRKRPRRVRRAGTTTLTVSPIIDIREGDILRVERVER